ncbi:unnamed protein product, partial [Chrysoparadoxa australica]
KRQNSFGLATSGICRKWRENSVVALRTRASQGAHHRDRADEGRGCGCSLDRPKVPASHECAAQPQEGPLGGSPEGPQEGPLKSNALLGQVLGYVGKGDSCFKRVNRQWNDIYVKLFGAKTTYDAALSSVARVELAVEGCLLTEKLFRRAAVNGNLEVCMRLKSVTHSWSLATCHAAARSYQTLLQLLRQAPEPCPWDEDTCAGAARGGHLRVLQWLIYVVLQWLWEGPDACPWNNTTCEAAARGGHLGVLQWLLLILNWKMQIIESLRLSCLVL